MSTFSAGPLGGDKGDPKQAHSVALTTSKALVGVWVGWSGGGPGLSPLSFFFQSLTTGGFKVIGDQSSSPGNEGKRTRAKSTRYHTYWAYDYYASIVV